VKDYGSERNYGNWGRFYGSRYCSGRRSSWLHHASVIAKDVPGFIVNRINAAFRNEAYICLEEGVATLEDIDKEIKMGLNHPMGPFELADFVGLDVGFNVISTLYAGYKDARFAPNPTLEKLVICGDLGRKSGKGWYDYSGGERKSRTDVKF
jgi:3-hydroxybutyryl-CoA dehydrogenase